MIQDPQWSQLMKNLPELNSEAGPWIAGGSARKLFQAKDWSSGDVDVFFASDQQRTIWQESFEKSIQHPADPFLESILQKAKDVWATLVCSPATPPAKTLFWGRKTLHTPNADTYQVVMDNQHQRPIKIQLIKTRYSHSLQDLWTDFDFTVSCFAADKSRVYWLPQAEQDLKDNVLRDHNSTNKRNRAMRIFKHYTYGFEVPPSMLLEAAKLINDGDFECVLEY
jgi:hypothetical protein